MNNNGNTRRFYKKRMCRYNKKKCCNYEKDSYLCRFAHNEEELKKKPVYEDMGQLNNCSPFSKNKNKNENLFCAVIDKLLTKNKIYANVCCNTYNIIMSFLDITVCSWCCKSFYVNDDNYYFKEYHYILNKFNSKFFDNEFRHNNPLGTLCTECAVYKIPIQCDVCKLYTNSKNISINYSIEDDEEIYNILQCPHQSTPMRTENIYKTKKNICYCCMIDYYESVMPVGFGWCRRTYFEYNCIDKFSHIIKFRYGRRRKWNIYAKKFDKFYDSSDEDFF